MQLEQFFAPFEVKAFDDAGSFSGYAAIFGAIDSQNDSIQPGAFAQSLLEHRKAGTLPALLWMHDAAKPVGVWHSAREDAKGLRVAGKLTLGVGQADEAYALMRDRAVTGLSIGYKARQSYHDTKSGSRVLTDVDLKEISLVALPANAAARVDQVKADTARLARVSNVPADAVFIRTLADRIEHNRLVLSALQ